MKQNNIKSVFVLLTLMLCLNVSLGEIIFEDNFDSHDDFAVTQPIHPWSILRYQGESDIPTGYFGYYVAGSAFDTDPQHSSIVINSSHARSGKAVTFWCESADTVGDWNADKQLFVSIPDQEEIYISFWIKYDPNWQWGTYTDNSLKLIRAMHYWGGTPIKYFEGGNEHPIGQIMLARYNSGTSNDAFYGAYRYENVYFPNSGAVPYHVRSQAFYPTGANYGGTGIDYTEREDWQHYVLHLKMNSEVGVPDGVFEFYIDDVLQFSDHTLAWSDEGSQEDPRLLWNMISISGNDYNFWAPTSELEQWYAIDDFVVSTEYVPGNYVIGSTPVVVENSHNFDNNSNQLIDTVELLDIITAWKKGELSMTETFNYLNKWKRRERV